MTPYGVAMWSGKRIKQVETLFQDQCNAIGKSLEASLEILKSYQSSDSCPQKPDTPVHFWEHQADEIRRNIGLFLYQGAFLPVYREDYFHLSEIADRIADKAQDFTSFLILTQPSLPGHVHEILITIAEFNIRIFRTLEIMFKTFIVRPEEIWETGHQVRSIERKIDRLKFELTGKIFKLELEKVEKLHLKQTLDLISAISNLIEDTADQIEIMSAKHRL